MREMLYVTIGRFKSNPFAPDEEYRYKIPYGEVCFYNYKYYILDGGTIFLDKTLKFVYFYCDGERYKYKVLNIQSKPSTNKNCYKCNILEYKRLVEKEIQLKNQFKKEKEQILKFTRNGEIYYGQ